MERGERHHRIGRTGRLRQRSRARYGAFRRLLLLVCVVVPLFGGAAISIAGAPRAQETFDVTGALQPLGVLTAVQPAGVAVSVRAATFILGAGQATLPVTSRSGLLVVVQSGTVRLLADRAPSKTLQGTTEQLGGIDRLIPGLAAQAESGLRPAPDPIVDGTAVDPPFADAARWYTLPAGFGFHVEPDARLQFRGVTQAQVLIIAIGPEAARS